MTIVTAKKPSNRYTANFMVRYLATDGTCQHPIHRFLNEPGPPAHWEINFYEDYCSVLLDEFSLIAGTCNKNKQEKQKTLKEFWNSICQEQDEALICHDRQRHCNTCVTELMGTHCDDSMLMMMCLTALMTENALLFVTDRKNLNPYVIFLASHELDHEKIEASLKSEQDVIPTITHLSMAHTRGRRRKKKR